MCLCEIYFWDHGHKTDSETFSYFLATRAYLETFLFQVSGIQYFCDKECWSYFFRKCLHIQMAMASQEGAFCLMGREGQQKADETVK